jgi:autotransporter-associated beta strand protein
VFWRGYIDGRWDTSSINWFSSGKGVAYQQNDSVVFDDSLTGGPNIVITTVVTPSSFTMNNTLARYSFGGPGKISGTTGLSKNGSGLWILGETGGDDFTGGISVAGGTLFLINANSAMSGGLSIASGATVLAGINDDRGSLPSGPLMNDGTLTLSRSNDVTISASISGTGLINQNGDGALILTANNTFSGTIAVTDGTLALTDSGSISIANVNVSNAKLDVSGVSSGATTMVALGLTNSMLTLAVTNQSIPLTVAVLGMGGSTNTVSITTLPIFAEYPTTLSIVRAAAGVSGYNAVLGLLPNGYAGNISLSSDTTEILLTLTSGPGTTPPPAPVPPTIQNLSIIDGNVVLTGTNNSGPGGTFHVLASTNIALPVTNWTVVTNGTFDSSGNFNTTNAIDAAEPQSFYILQVP